MAELEAQEQLAGAGADAPYLISGDAPQIKEAEGIDQAEISANSKTFISSQVNSALSSKTLSSLSNIEDGEHYIENTSDDGNYGSQTNALTDDDSTEGSGGVKKRGGGRGHNGEGDGDAIDTISDLDQDLHDRVMNFDDEDYLRNENGYWEPDPEKLEEWAKYILSRTNVLMSLLIAIQMGSEARKLAEEAFSGVPIEPENEKLSAKEAFNRKIRFLQKIVQQAIVNVFKLANLRNQEIFDNKMAKIKDESKSGWFKFRNFWTGGRSGKDLQKKALREQKKFLEATQRTLKSLQKVLNSLAKFLTETAGDGEGAVFNLTMAKYLTGFSSKLEEVNSEVDSQLDEISKKLDKLCEKKKWYETFGRGWADLFMGLLTFDWEQMWNGIGGIFQGIADGCSAINPIFGQIMECIFAPVQWSVTLMKDPYGTLLQITGLILHAIQWVTELFGAEYEDDWRTVTVDWLQEKRHEGRRICDGITGNEDSPWNVSGGFGGSWFLGSDSTYWMDKLEYMDDVNVQQLIEDYRGGLVGIQNAYRSYMSLKMMPADLRNIARNKFTGLTGIRNNAELLMLSAESALSHVISMTDQTTTQLMVKIRLHNSIVRLCEDYRKAEKAEIYGTLGIVGAVVAVVLSIIASIFGQAWVWFGTVMFIAFVSGVLSGLSFAEQQHILSNLKGFDPMAPVADPEEDGEWSHGDIVLDGLEQLERAERANRRAAAKNQGSIVTTADDYYVLNSQAFAAYEMKQNMLNNAIRAIFNLMKNGKDLRRIVDAEFSGSAAQDSGEALLANAVENLLMQKQMVLSAVKFQHQEVINAQNIQRQCDIRQKNAQRQAAWTVVGAVAGALLGAAIPGLGWAAGAAIGAALAGSSTALYNALKDQALNMTFDISNRELEATLARMGGDSVEAKLDRAEAQAYQQLLNEGIVSTGDGYHGVNFGLVSQIYARIGAIYSAKEMLAKARALKSELRNIVKQQFTGISTGSSGDLTQTVNRANFATAMRVAGNLVSFLQSKAQVMNRARDAQKAVNVAAGTFAVNCALSITGFSLGAAAGQVGNWMSKIAQMMPAFMSLTNALASLITSARSFQKDMGHYEKYDAKTTVDKTGKRVSNSNSVDGRLDELEYDILCDMGNNMFQTIDSGFSGVSPLAAKLSGRMRGLYNVRQALATARSILTDAKRAAGARVSRSDHGKDFVEQYESAALALLDSLKQALETMVERKNQIEQAKTGIIFSSISAALSLLSIALGFVAASKWVEANNIHADIKGMRDAKINHSRKTKLEGQRSDAEKSAKKWDLAASAISLASTILTEFIIKPIYDGVKKAKGEKAEISEKTAGFDAEKAEGKDRAKGDVFSSMNRADAEMAALEFSLSASQLNTQAAAYVATRNERIVQNVLPAIRGIGQWIGGFINRNTSIYDSPALAMAKNKHNSATDVAKQIVKGPEKKIIEDLESLVALKDKKRALKILAEVKRLLPPEKKTVNMMHALASIAAAMGQKPQKAAVPVPPKSKPVEKSDSSSKAKMDYAAYIEKNLPKMDKELQKVISEKKLLAEEVKACGNKKIGLEKAVKTATPFKAKELEKRIKDLEREIQAKSKELSAKKKEAFKLKTEIKHEKEKVENLKKEGGEKVKDLAKKAIGLVDDITSSRKEIEATKKELGETNGKIKGLKAKIGNKKTPPAKREESKKELEKLEKKLKALEAKNGDQNIKLAKLEAELAAANKDRELWNAALAKLKTGSTKLAELEARAGKVNKEIADLMSRLGKMQGDLKALRIELAKIIAEGSSAKIGNAAAGNMSALLGGGFLASLVNAGTKMLKKAVENIDASKEKGKLNPDGLSHDGKKTGAELASAANAVKKYDIQGKYKRAVAEEKLVLKRKQGVMVG